MELGYVTYKILDKVWGVKYYKLFQKYVRKEMELKQQRYYAQFVKEVESTKTIDKSPLMLIIDFEKFDTSNNGEPYVNCHIWRLGKQIAYTDKLLFCGELCSLEREHNAEFMCAVCSRMGECEVGYYRKLSASSFRITSYH